MIMEHLTKNFIDAIKEIIKPLKIHDFLQAAQLHP